MRVDPKALEQLKLYNSLEVGKFYRFDLTGKYLDIPWRSKVYRVLRKSNRGNDSYSILCEGLDDKGQKGLIYNWIASSSSAFRERVIGAMEVADFNS